MIILPQSMSYIYKVFEHLIQLWMGICLWSQHDVKKSRSGVFAPPANALALSIEEKDLLFCTGIGRWPLPLPSYLCNPANALGLSIEEKDLLFCCCLSRHSG